MGLRLTTLLVARCSALLIGTGVSAHADPPPPANQDEAEVQEGMEEQEEEESTAEWGTVVEKFCELEPGVGPIDPNKDLEGARKQFSDAGIQAYDEAYRMSPLEFTQDPVPLVRAALLGPERKNIRHRTARRMLTYCGRGGTTCASWRISGKIGMPR
ncbi:hypothetical protein [Nocardia iowensis]|uniref:Uncharacterized protein n=1 Tax=Nocardia iowensis TaxID=204891 RepID=A0ABX8RK61_NOCIO|nr:hypothetical protein [Nocardia iowensis]QXN89999.1 hypothetical protein KV110_31825 [Nocardia iowensis]